MNLLPVAQQLEDSGLGLLAETIFINMIPVECPRGLLLRNPLAGTAIDYELPKYYKTTFQLIARSQSYSDGEDLIAQAVTALTISNKVLGDMSVRYMRPQALPVVFPLSKGGLLEFSVTFDVNFVR
jgi:hypothetical protein